MVFSVATATPTTGSDDIPYPESTKLTNNFPTTVDDVIVVIEYCGFGLELAGAAGGRCLADESMAAGSSIPVRWCAGYSQYL